MGSSMRRYEYKTYSQNLEVMLEPGLILPSRDKAPTALRHGWEIYLAIYKNNLHRFLRQALVSSIDVEIVQFFLRPM